MSDRSSTLKAVILAAGQGVRLLPLTYNRSKHMLPVAGRPILEHIVEALKSVGISNIVMVIGYNGGLIRSHFGDGSAFGVKIDYVRQERINGTGAAVGLVRDRIDKSDFLLIYGDIVIQPKAIEPLLKEHEAYGGNCVSLVEVDDPQNYGIVRIEGHQIKAIVEKPRRGSAPSNLALAGIYILTPEIFGSIGSIGPSERGELEITDAMNVLIGRGLVFRGTTIPRHEWIDVGKPWDLLEANQRSLSKLEARVEGHVEPNASIIGPVVVEEGAIIKSGSYVEGPALIRAGSVIGPNAHIRPYTSIGRNVVVGTSCEVKSSIVMDGTRIPHLCYVGDSIIGEGCNLGAGTIVANLRLDEGTVGMSIKGEVIDTGRRKLGAVIGDNVRTGINVSLMPGVKIGANARIGPGLVVYKDVEEGECLILKQDVERRIR